MRKRFTYKLFAFILAVICLPSCVHTLEKVSGEPSTLDNMAIVVFNPSACRYEISKDAVMTATKSVEALETIDEELERGNSFLDSILCASIKEGKGSVYFTEGESGIVYKAFLGKKGPQLSEMTSSDDSMFVDPPLDTLSTADTIIIPKIYSPRGTLGNRESTTVFAPYYMSGYDCSCFGHSPFVIHIVKTAYLDPSPIIGSCRGLAANVHVPIAASNIFGIISYESSDSNVPFCMYVGSPSEEPDKQ